MSTRTTSQTHLSLWFKILNGLLVVGTATVFSLVGVAAVTMLVQAVPATSEKTYWFISRSSGMLAYLLLTFGIMWGLVQSGAILRPIIPPLLALGLHSFLNWGALVMSLLHGLILLGDSYIKLSLIDVSIPFASTYEPLLMGLGVVGFYMMLLLSSSFYARKWLGQKTFRMLHYFSYPTFFLVSWHGLGIGTDRPLMWPLTVASVAAVLLLTSWRMATAGLADLPPKKA